MNPDFLISPPSELYQAFDPEAAAGGATESGRLTRRSFVKRTGAASVGVIVAWNTASGGTGTMQDPLSVDPDPSAASWILVKQVDNFPKNREKGVLDTTDYKTHVSAYILGSESPVDNSIDLDASWGGGVSSVYGVAYINGDPEIPKIYLKNVDAATGTVLSWKVTFTSERTERSTYDDSPSYSASSVSATQWWKIPLDKIRGGKVRVECNYLRKTGTNTYESRTSFQIFYIRGKNPMDADAKAYIDTKCAAVMDNFSYAWAIMKYESHQGEKVYNQFNSGGDGPGSKELPNLHTNNGDHGYGMGQRDKGSHQAITTAETYDWKANVDSCMALLKTKQQFADSVLSGISTYYYDVDNDSNPDSPPDLTLAGLTLSARDWITVMGYNGMSGCPSQPTGTPGGTQTKLTPVTFNPTRTPNWTIVDNARIYGSQVAPYFLGTDTSSE